LNLSEITIEEGESGTYSIWMSDNPSETITVTVSGDSDYLTVDTDDLVSGNQWTITFTETNWSVPQTVTITALHDDNGVDDRFILKNLMTESGKAPVSKDIMVIVTDDDAPALIVTPTELIVTEGESTSYTVKLSVEPMSDVNVSISSASDDLGIDVNSTIPEYQFNLIFTPANWGVPQSVQIIASEDDNGFNDSMIFTNEASGGEYETAKKELVYITVIDNDEPALIITPTSLTVEEEEKNTYKVQLSTEPRSTVTVIVETNSSVVCLDTDADMENEQNAMTFTDLTWNIPQTVIVTAIADDDGSNDSATLIHISSGGDYESVNEEVNITVIDNDEASLVITPTKLIVEEEGSNTYEVKLATKPFQPVTVTVGGVSGDVAMIDTDINSNGSQSNLIFTSENWGVTQTVTVYGKQEVSGTTLPTLLTNTAFGDDYGSVSVEIVEVTVLPINDAPVPSEEIPDQTLTEGGVAVQIDLAPYFRDADGDVLMYTARSDAPDVVLSEIEGTLLSLSPIMYGITTVVITAEDPEGLSATQSVQVRVSDSPQKEILRDMLAAVARGHLASLRTTLSHRMDMGACNDIRIEMMGRQVPMKSSDITAVLSQIGGSASQWGRSSTQGIKTRRHWGEPDHLMSILGFGRLTDVDEMNFLINLGGFERLGAKCNHGGVLWSIWGQGDLQISKDTHSQGLPDSRYDGRLLTAYLGVDVRLGRRWLTGIAVSRSEGTGDWHAGGSMGDLTQQMTTVYPYLQWASTAVSIIASVGIGQGNAMNERSTGKVGESRTQLQLGMIEVERDLVSIGNLSIDMKGDAGWSRLKTDDGPETIDEINVAVNQVRLGTNLSYPIKFSGGQLTPSGSIYARHDGRVGPTGVGIEVAGGLRGTFGILSVDAKGRVLAYHAEKEYAERGAALTVSFASNKSREGLAVSLTPMWGNSAQNTGSFLQDLFETNVYRTTTSSNLWGLDAQASYGMSLSRSVQIKLNGGYNMTHKKPSAGIRIFMQNTNDTSSSLLTQTTLR